MLIDLILLICFRFPSIRYFLIDSKSSTNKRFLYHYLNFKTVNESSDFSTDMSGNNVLPEACDWAGVFPHCSRIGGCTRQRYGLNCWSRSRWFESSFNIPSVATAFVVYWFALRWASVFVSEVLGWWCCMMQIVQFIWNYSKSRQTYVPMWHNCICVKCTTS